MHDLVMNEKADEPLLSLMNSPLSSTDPGIKPEKVMVDKILNLLFVNVDGCLVKPARWLMKDEPIFGVLSNITTKLALPSRIKDDGLVALESGEVDDVEDDVALFNGIDALCDYVCDPLKQLAQTMNSVFVDITLEDDLGENMESDEEINESHEIPSMMECGGIMMKTLKCMFLCQSIN